MLDSTDRKLLGLLTEDARSQYGDLGKSVHLSAPAVHARVKKLETQGVIEGYTIRVNAASVGRPVCAFIRLITANHTCAEIAKSLRAFAEVEECHSVAGEDCMLVKVRTESPEALQDLLGRMSAVPGFTRTITTIVLKSHFERGTRPANA